MCLGDFKTQKEALETADALIVQNQQDFEHEGGKLDHAMPLLVRFFYITGHGKKRSGVQTEHKELEGAHETKTKKALAESGVFVEAMGATGDPSSSSGVKVEHVHHMKMLTAKDTLRRHIQCSSILHLLVYIVPMLVK